MDMEAARAAVDAAREGLYWLRALSTILFVNVVIVLPFALIYRPMALYLGTLVSIIVANYLIVLTLALAAHWNLFRDDAGGRFHLILHLILLPVSAMHPVSKLSREILSRFLLPEVAPHPCVICCNPIHREQSQCFAGRYARHGHHRP